jgi:type II secretory pathway predicted ATPase ExeA
MYLDFYNLQQDPFSSTAASGMLFLSRSHQVALQARLDGSQAGSD